MNIRYKYICYFAYVVVYHLVRIYMYRKYLCFLHILICSPLIFVLYLYNMYINHFTIQTEHDGDDDMMEMRR